MLFGSNSAGKCDKMGDAHQTLCENSEFLWQESHTAHVTPEVAEMEELQMIDVYTQIAYQQDAIPVIAGRKSEVDTFAGASKTHTIEVMMGNQKALQAGTSHNLGQNFSRAFGTLVCEIELVIIPSFPQVVTGMFLKSMMILRATSLTQEVKYF